MCRLLGIVSSEPTDFKILLREAPRSLAALSREHRDGWGIAVFDDDTSAWRIDKGIACASEDSRFHQLAVGSRGELLVAHIRQKTVGDASLVNTHPFGRDRWIFAHNGTIKDVAWLRLQCSSERLGEVAGQTDSELLFAWLLTRLDDAGITNTAASAQTDLVLGAAARTARDHAGFGAFNFLLSDGITTYAHRFGRTMFMLDLGPTDEVRSRRRASDGTVLETPWSMDRHAVFIASERITDEAWQTLDEGSLLRVDRVPAPQWRQIAA
jgi:predicted glutamine amidotransferase